MEATLFKVEVIKTEQDVQAPAEVMRELSALELALVGGGTANVAFI